MENEEERYRQACIVHNFIFLIIGAIVLMVLLSGCVTIQDDCCRGAKLLDSQCINGTIDCENSQCIHYSYCPDVIKDANGNIVNRL